MIDETETNEEGHDRRVTNILTRARQEVGVRDLVTFSFARMWTVLLALGAVLYTLIEHSNTVDAEAADLDPKN